MIYLFIAILCSASIALIFKFSENNNLNRYVVTSFNYLTAFSISIIIILFNLNIFHDLNGNFFNEFFRVFVKSEGTFSNLSSLIWAFIIGNIAGVFFFLAFYLYQKCIRENGVSLSGAFSKLGILLPVFLSIIFWKEYPNNIQAVGITLSILSIIIVNIPSKGENFKLNYLLILLFVFGGFAEFSNKLFQNYALVIYKEVFLFFVFFSAFWISLLFAFKSTKIIKKKDVLTGIIVGIPNLFSSFFLILSLQEINTSIAFAAYTSGSILLINIFGILLFKEKLKKNELISIFLIIFALTFMNINL